MGRRLGPTVLTLVLPLVLLTGLALTACGERDDGGGTTTSVTSLENVRWREDLGCGFGFGKVDGAEHFRLTVHRSGDRAGALPRSVELPDPAWKAEVVTGKHLAANWCNDLPTDPRAEVVRTWQVVEGTLTFEGDLPPLTTPRSPLAVRARLTGIVVEDADGERTAMADVALHNGVWGFFAG